MAIEMRGSTFYLIRRVKELRNWLLEERAKLSKHNGVAKAIDYFCPGTGNPSL